MLKSHTKVATLLLSIIYTSSFGQASIKDSSINMMWVSLNYSFFTTHEDFAKSYEQANTINIGFVYKMKNNFLAEVNTGILFSNRIADTTILDNISTSGGYLINGQGQLEAPRFELRGFHSNISIGKIFPVLSPNPNSGICIKAGVGYIQHRTLIEFDVGPLYQLDEDYRKGYDKLTGGLAFNQFIGYYYFGNRDYANFHFGFNIIEANTQSLRSYNFNEMRADTDKHFDLLIGFNVGLNISLFERAAESVYYY
jgi:hypothetical protein